MRIKAIISYKGTKFQGYQKQKNSRTIQQEIEVVLEKLLSKKISIFASGRTDAGVHALGQVIHFDIDDEHLNLKKFHYAINCLLDKDIRVKSLRKASNSFHCRYKATEKHYRYLISLEKNNPFNHEFMYEYFANFDKKLFIEASRLFIGKHNFMNFTSKKEDEKDFVRNIKDIRIKDNKKSVKIDFYGDGFMRYEIRMIVGSLLAVASKKEPLSFIESELNSNQREIVHYKAPPEGLYLVSVKY